MKRRFARIRTSLPGPRSAELLERKQNALPQAAGHNFPVFIEKAANALLTDIDGNVFIDFASGIGVTGVGHANPAVVEAAANQLARFTHVCFPITMYEPYVKLAETLNALVPGDFEKKTYLVNSGAEAVENAVKIARAATGRSAVVAFEHAFHGRTLLGMSLTGKVKPYRLHFGPMAPEVYHLPFPNCSHCPHASEEDCCMEREGELERLFLTRVPPEQVAAILFEPVLGEGGILPMRRRFLQRLFDFARENGILLIADEIQTGWCRTGKWFAMEHYGLAADITVTAKALGGGLPISAVTGRAEVMDRVHAGGIGSTYGGNPVACAAALAAIEEMKKKKLAQRAEAIGKSMREGLEPLKSKLPAIHEVRGLGAMIGVELVRNGDPGAPDREAVQAVRNRCFENGLITLRAGTHANVIRLLPPLTIEDEVLREGMEILTAALEATLAASH